MPGSSALRHVLALTLASALAAFSRDARAEDAEPCVKAAEEAQSQRDAGHLTVALDNFVRCSQDACPLVVRRDCLTWTTQVEQLLPSVLVHAVDARGADVVGVRLLIDGKAVRERLDGRAVPLDPGQHHVRFEVRGAAPVEQDLLVSEGQKHRILDVKFEAPLTTDGALDATTAGPDLRTVIGFGLIGLGVVALGTFGVLEIVAQGDYRTLRDGCGVTRSCTDAQLSPTQTKFDAAKIALAVGVVSAGVGIPLVILGSKAGARRASLGAAPLDGGAALRLQGTF